MSYLELLKQIRNQQIPKVILLYGTETYFIQQIIDALVKHVIHNDKDHLSTYDLEETPIDNVIADAETYPFFGEQKLIIARNPTFLSTKQINIPVEHHVDRLETYIKHPVDYSVLVLEAPYETLDKRKKITKQLSKHATVVECQPVKEHELDKWISHMAKSLQISIEKDAEEILLAEFVNDLRLIENELIKLSLFVGEQGVVTREIAEELVSSTPETSALRLVDAVIERDITKAFSVYHDLKKMQEEPISMIALLAYQFRMIYQVKLLKEKGYSQYQMQKSIRAHPYVIKIALNRERLFTHNHLQKIMNQLTNTDAAVKSGEMDPDLAIEMLLYNIIHVAPVTR